MDEAALALLRLSGWIPAIALLAAIAASPLARLRPAAASPLTRARRWLGISAATLAMGHALVALAIYLPPDEVWASVAFVAWLRSGALALALLVPLLATSFAPVTQALRVRAWKPLHRLAYPALLLLLHHLALGPFAPRSAVLVAAGATAVVLAARLLPRRRDRTTAETKESPWRRTPDRAHAGGDDPA